MCALYCTKTWRIARTVHVLHCCNKLIGVYVHHRAVEEAELRLRMEELEALEAAFDGLDGPPGPPLPPPPADFNWRSSTADMDLPHPR